MSGVDFHPVAKDTAKSMMKVVDYILGLPITKADKLARMVKVFNLVGSDFYMQMFNANSEMFDSTAIGTTDYGNMTNQIERLAQKITRNDYLGRDARQLVQSFYDSALGDAQNEAFRNAISLDKHPTLTRTMVGETCDWCQERAGVHTDPDGDLFARHAHCDCLFVVSGYKSRNGALTNYNKKGIGNPGLLRLSDEKARKKIGVNASYWGNDMDDGERWFAKNYPGSIEWINRNKFDSNGRKVPTNDFVDVYTGIEYELKSPESTRGRSISRAISEAASKGKRNFMINLGNRQLGDSLIRSLEQYNVRHPSDKQIEILKIFTMGKEVRISLKE